MKRRQLFNCAWVVSNMVSLSCKALEFCLSDLVELADELSLPDFKCLLKLRDSVAYVRFHSCVLVRYLVTACI